MSNRSERVNCGRRQGGRRLAAGAFLVLLGMLTAAVCGYVSRSPLGRSQPLTSLIDFDPPYLARCGDVAAAWEAFRNLPHYREFARTPQGREFLASNAIARAAGGINERGKVLGLSLMDTLDVVGGEVVVAALPVNDGYAFLLASRVGPVANALLGGYAALGAAAPLATDGGDWWAVIDRSQGIAWSKVGDVLVASNSPGLLARFVAAARRAPRGSAEAAAVLTELSSPQVALKLPGAGSGEPKFCVLSLRIGEPDGAASGDPDAGFASFARLVFGFFPSNTCAGGAWKIDPVVLWRLALAAMPEPERVAVERYVEDHLCSVLDVDDFEHDVLGRLTGEFAFAVSSEPDEWTSLAWGAPAPTLSIVFRMRRDERFETRLRYALVEAAASLDAAAPHLTATGTGEHEHSGQRMAVLHVGRVGSPTGADAGYFVMADPEAPGHSLVVASTSINWLLRAIEAREKREPSLPEQGWFRRLAAAQPIGRSAFFFAHGGLAADVFGRAACERHAGSSPGPWLRLLGPISASGNLGEDGVIRASMRVGHEKQQEPVE